MNWVKSMSLRVAACAESRLIASSSLRRLSILNTRSYSEEDDFYKRSLKRVDDSIRQDIPAFPRGERWKNPFSVTEEEDERFIAASTLVWWDMDAAPLPPSADASALPWAIKNGLNWAGYWGQIVLFGYGDKDNMPCQVWDQLLNAGAHISHVPSLNGDKDAIFSRILLDMGMSTKEYPSPSNHMLISSDMHYKAAVEELRTYGYNFLLARSSTEPTLVLESIAFRIWNWEDLVEGGLPLLHQQTTQLERPAGRTAFATPTPTKQFTEDDIVDILFY